MAAPLDNPSFVGDNRTEVAAAKTAALAQETELHLRNGGYTAILVVNGMPGAHIGQVVNLIHLLLREGLSRWILHHTPFIILLGKLATAESILLQIFELKGLGKFALVRAYFLIGRQRQIIPNVIHIGHLVAGPLHILNIANLHTLLQISGDFEKRPLTHAENQHIGTAVHQHGTAHGIRPIIIMRHAAQAGLNATDDNGHIGIKFPQAVAIDYSRPLRTEAGLAARRIRILMTHLFRRGKLIEQGIHIPRRDKKPQPWFSQAVKIPGRMPVRLGNNPYFIAMLFE